MSIPFWNEQIEAAWSAIEVAAQRGAEIPPTGLVRVVAVNPVIAIALLDLRDAIQQLRNRAGP
jgi:hypothetical protein